MKSVSYVSSNSSSILDAKGTQNMHIFVKYACLTALFITIQPLAAHAISMRHDVPEQDYFDLAAVYTSVGRISSNSVSTGAMVTSTKFLTAAHSVDSDRDGVVDNPLGNYSLLFGTNVSSPDTTVNALTSIVIHPLWSATAGDRTYDLAVVTLTNPLTSVGTLGLSDADPLGMETTLVGYGLHGIGTSSSQTLDGRRRAATNIIDSTNDTIRFDFDSPSEDTNYYTAGSATPLALEGGTAGGDSGSPLLVDFGGFERIVGVLSGGFNTFGSGAEYGDVSVYAPINDADNITFLANQGVNLTPIPEPSVALIFTSGLVLMVLCRRK